MKNLKALMEKRDELKQKMEDLVKAADTEKRAMSEEETATFDAAEREIRAIDETVEREERARRIDQKAVPSDKEERAAADERAFADYILGRSSELRTGEQNMSMDNNGAIIPTTLPTALSGRSRTAAPFWSEPLSTTSRAPSRCRYGARPTPLTTLLWDIRPSLPILLPIPVSSPRWIWAGIWPGR